MGMRRARHRNDRRNLQDLLRKVSAYSTQIARRRSARRGFWLLAIGYWILDIGYWLPLERGETRSSSREQYIAVLQSPSPAPILSRSLTNATNSPSLPPPPLPDVLVLPSGGCRRPSGS